MYSFHQNTKSLALKAFEVHHIPMLIDHLSLHEIDELKQLNHIQIQDIGKKINKLNKHRTNRDQLLTESIVNSYELSINNMLLHSPEQLITYYDVVFKTQSPPITYDSNILKTIPRKAINTTTTNSTHNSKSLSSENNNRSQKNKKDTTKSITKSNISSNSHNQYRQHKNNNTNHHHNRQYNRNHHRNIDNSRYQHRSNNCNSFSNYNNNCYIDNHYNNDFHDSRIHNSNHRFHSRDYEHHSQRKYHQTDQRWNRNDIPSWNTTLPTHSPSIHSSSKTESKESVNMSQNIVVKTNNGNDKSPPSLSNPIIMSKVKFGEKKLKKNTSLQLERDNIKSKIIDRIFLHEPVMIYDKSTFSKSQSLTKQEVDYDLISGKIDRCFKEGEKLFWKIELARSKFVIVVDTKLCSHIVDCTETKKYYEVTLYDRSKKELSKLRHKASCQNKLKDKKKAYLELEECTPVDPTLCLCVFCGTHSKAIRKRKRVDTTHTNGKSEENASLNIAHKPLICSVCNSFSCHTCLSALLMKLDEQKETTDVWYGQVKSFLSSNIVPINFVGHCCELSQKIIKNSPTSLECSKKSLFENKILYDGCLHIPSMGILIDTPFVSHVDVHGLGKEFPTEGTRGLLHGVVDYKTAKICHEKGIIPDGSKSIILYEKTVAIDFKDIKRKNRSIKCFIQMFQINTSINEKELKHHHPTTEAISCSRLLKQCDIPNDVDVWVILGVESLIHDNCHLVNMRWKSGLDFNKWNNDKTVETFFNTLKGHCKNNGYEVNRKGGSNGFTTAANTDILNLLSTNKAFPRKGKGVKLIQKEKKWTCYYLGVRESCDVTTSSSKRKMVCWSYSQPRIGGNFDMTDTLANDYSDLFNSMTLAKYNSARLTVELDTLLHQNIQSLAIRSALEDMKGVRTTIFKDYALSKEVFCEYQYTKRFIHMLTMKNRFTLVAYPCGYHHDTFDKKSYSLENKICFGFQNNYENNDTINIGRGGKGEGITTFCVLDWTKTS